MEEKIRHIEPGTPKPDPKYHIDITANGPYLVFGQPTVQQEIITLNKEHSPWQYTKGHSFQTDKEPTALCRCGHSKNHPYCDGSHHTAKWDPTLTADNVPLLQKADLYDSPTVQLSDNPTYCAHTRFCMAKGSVWELIKNSDAPQTHDLAVHESTHCPAGRLKLWDKQKGTFYEPPLKPTIGLIEDPQEHCSGPLWIQGGIPINGPDGTAYEQRNRVTLCRCGASNNKPFCDSSHVINHFNDQLPLPDAIKGK
ncbi:MAG: CDGSH iron-sulfur domain-containing protein [Odoribacter sp.]